MLLLIVQTCMTRWFSFIHTTIVYIFASNNVLLKVDSLLQKYKELKDKYVANRNSTKEKLTEYIEKDAGVKLTEFHDQLKTFRADLSKQHVVSCVCPSPNIFVNGFVDAFS